MISIMNEQQQFIYLAGYIDGDGCFRANITKQKSGNNVYERSITITSVKKEPISMIHNLTGGFVSTYHKAGNRRRIYVWTVKNIEAILTAQNVLPYLVLKKKFCEFFISYCQSIFPCQRVTIERKNLRHSLLDSMKNEMQCEGAITQSAIENLKSIGKILDPTEQDFIYLAGLIDAEGCFRISKRFRKSTNIWVYNTCLEIGNTRIELIKWAYERFGGSITYTPYKKENRKNSAIWSCHAQILYPILKKVVDFLINKREVCEELIKFQNTILKNGGDRHSDMFKKTYASICQEREKIIEKIHNLNRKGL